MSGKRQLRAGIVAVAACWLCAGLAPFRDAAAGVAAPADFARDYVAARARLENGPGAPPRGEEGNRLAERLGAPRVELLGAPYFIHPPTATLVTLPFAFLPWPMAAAAWAVIAAIALVWLAGSLLAIAGRDRSAGVMLGTAILLALWPPTLYCLEKGQWSLWLAALMAAGFRAFESGRSRRAGVLFGVAAALKVTPLLMLPLFARRDRRAALAMLATLAGALLVALVVVGPAALGAFLAGSGANSRAWAPWVGNTASLAGVYARLTSDTRFARPLVAAPALGQAAFAVTAIVALGGAAWTTLRGDEDPRARGRAAAVWMALTVILNPLGWGHTLLMLLPSLVVLGRERRGWAPLAVAALLTLPRQALVAWAGPLPVAPAAGLWLGVHAAAAAALLVALCLPPVANSR
ncbi:MAG TPA: glycosyltransferase family 87 protein [Polyangia bacterium]|nr:glycosyltransferase family 87 protein [Polyangia bacterium]